MSELEWTDEELLRAATVAEDDERRRAATAFRQRIPSPCARCARGRDYHDHTFKAGLHGHDFIPMPTALRTWTDDELYAAHNVAAELVGWTSDKPDTPERKAAVTMIALHHARAWQVSSALAMRHPDDLVPSGEAWEFCRRIRESLGVDEPAWRALEWAPAPNANDSFSATVGRALLEVGFMHFAPPGVLPNWHGLLTIGQEETARATGTSRADVSAALHDALVKFHLSGLRAATEKRPS